MKNDSILLTTSVLITILAVAGCGSTLPLVFVDKTNVGLEINGPNAEGTSGSIVLGFKTRSAAVVPVAVKKETNNSNSTPISAEVAKSLTERIEAIASEIAVLRSDGAVGNAVEIKKKETLKEDLRKIISSSQKSYDLIQSTKNGDRDALSVLGQFSANGTGGSDGAGFQLGRFFATGSAASRLADGFSAQLGSKSVPIKANDDNYEVGATGKLAGISVHANDLIPSGTQTKIRIPPQKGTAEFASGSGAFTYTANTDFKEGEDKFSYAVTDQLGNTSSAIVKLTRAKAAPPSASDTPKAKDQAFDIKKNVPTNGLDLLTKAPDDPSKFKGEIIKPPTKGTAAIDNNLKFGYAPNTDQVGSDTLTYRFTDKDGKSPSEDATVTLTIKE